MIQFLRGDKMVTEAQKKAAKKYQDERERVTVWVMPWQKAEWIQMAQAGGRSLTEFVIACVEAVGADLLPAPIKAKVYKLDGEKTELQED